MKESKDSVMWVDIYAPYHTFTLCNTDRELRIVVPNLLTYV